MNIDWKKLLTSKTFWLGVLEITVGIATYFSTLPKGVPVSGIIAGVATIIIRYFTTDSIKTTPTP